ncbi:hypothetical protein IJG29_03190 [Candidatus Saccharibacteria bacterium]|nr:hypothetical protein [Candidatus Saccharibacteria bacterium]
MKIGTAIVGIILSSFLGIMLNPTMMTASDSVAVTRLDVSYAGPTVVTVVSEVEPGYGGDFEIVAKNEPAQQVTISAEPTVYEPWSNVEEPILYVLAEEPPTLNDEIAILGNRVPLRRTSALTENAGMDTLAWVYGDKFIYGHNLSYVLGVMNAAYDGGWLVGSGFSVTMDGVTNYYTVVDAQIYTVKQASAKMNKFINATGHKLSIMTCYGENRLVIFAD